MAIKNITESDTLVMVGTPERAREMAAASKQLAKLGIVLVVFQDQALSDEWQRRCRARAAHSKAMELALQRQDDRNAKRRAKRKELALAA